MDKDKKCACHHAKFFAAAPKRLTPGAQGSTNALSLQ
jgi:hypothetical protein